MSSFVSQPLPGSVTCFHTATPKIASGFLYPVCIGKYNCDSSYSVCRDNYDSFLFMLILDGKGYIKIDGQTFHLSKGDIALIDCYRPHAYGAFQSLSFLWLHFDGINARNYYTYLTSLWKVCFSPSDETFRKMTDILTALFHGVHDGAATEIQMACWITELLTLSASEEVQNLSSIEDSKYATLSQQACGYMRRHYQDSLTLDAIASRLSVSTCHFIRQFKKETGITPHNYLLSVRINSAKFYLKTTRASVKEIGFLCGFQSENHFCISFKRATGMTPGSYREENLP